MTVRNGDAGQGKSSRAQRDRFETGGINLGLDLRPIWVEEAAAASAGSETEREREREREGEREIERDRELESRRWRRCKSNRVSAVVAKANAKIPSPEIPFSAHASPQVHGPNCSE